jgi:hypothetical protein
MSDEENLPDIPDAAPVAEAAPSQAESYSAPSYEPSAPVNVYDAFKALPDFQGRDDLDIARNLYQSYTGFQEAQRQLQQYQQVVPYAQDYLRNQREFEAWKQAQAQAAQPKPEETPKWWNPPQVKDTWKNYIVRDPQTGREMIDPNAPFEAQQALREYQTYTADFARKFVTDPESTLKPFVEQVAMQKAQELVQQQLSQYQTQNYVSSLENQNADWLYTPEGQVSQEGQAIQGYIAQAQQIGIQDPQARWQYATGMLQRDLLNLRYQQMQGQIGQIAQMQPAPAPTQQPVATQDMQFLRERATRAPNRSGGTTEPRTPRARMTFEERLKNQLAADGVI